MPAARFGRKRVDTVFAVKRRLTGQSAPGLMRPSVLGPADPADEPRTAGFDSIVRFVRTVHRFPRSILPECRRIPLFVLFPGSLYNIYERDFHPFGASGIKNGANGRAGSEGPAAVRGTKGQLQKGLLWKKPLSSPAAIVSLHFCS